MVVKLVFITVISFIVTEMKEDTINSNAMYMVEIENLHASRNDMLISIFQNLFYYKLSPITNYK